MASPPTSVLLSMLEPWLARARDRMQLSIDTFASAEDLASGFWIQWSIEDHAIAIEDIEAMQLLELFVRVDFHAGYKALLEITNNAVYLDQMLDAAMLARSPLLPKFEIVGLCHAFTHSTLEKVLQWLVFDPEQYSPVYCAVQQTLLQSCTDRHHQGRISPVPREANNRIPIKFDLDLTELDHTSAENLLNKLAQVATLMKHPEQLELYKSWRHVSRGSSSTLSDTFSFEAVDVVFGSALTSAAVLDLIQRLRDQWNVSVEAIDLDSATREFLSETMVPFFRSLLAAETTDSPGEITLGFDAGLWQFYAATSALQISRIVQKIRLAGPEDVEEGVERAEISSRDRQCWWAWIAYTVFSAEASPTVQVVELDMDELTLDDVLVCERVLEMRDPLVYIASCLDGSFELRAPELATQAPTVVEVIPRATLTTGQEQVEICTKNEVETLRVVEDSPDKQHVRVVYPGAGVCWVHRSQIIRQREFTVPSASSTGGVHSICLDLGASTDIFAATRLLKSIGRGLLWLEIQGDEELVLDDDFFVRVFAACPSLRRLDLVTLDVASFQWLGTGGSRLESLSLRDVELR